MPDGHVRRLAWRFAEHAWQVCPHTGAQPLEVQSAWLDEHGRLFLATPAGLGLVRSLDMDVAADAVGSGRWVPQDVVFAILPLLEWVKLWRWSRREAVVAAGVFVAAAVVVFSPQMLVWWKIYGTPLTVPQGEGFLRWDASKWAFTLFSSRNGLLSWTPLVGLSLLGILILARRRRARGPSRCRCRNQRAR